MKTKVRDRETGLTAATMRFQSDDYLRAVCLVRAIADDCDDDDEVVVVVENGDCWLEEMAMAIVDGCKWKGWKWAVGGYL